MLHLFILISLLKPIEPPVGTIDIDGIFIDQFETQNIHWLEYMYDMKSKLDSIEYQKLKPENSNIWFEIPIKNNEPITLISHKQALEYCAWRSQIVSKISGKKVIYRLPTIEEWLKVANFVLTNNLKFEQKKLNKTKKKYESQSGQYLLSTKNIPTNKIINMFDNVSEMTQEYGVAIGANNSNLIDFESNLNQTYTYDKPSFYLGFRSVAEFVD